jgi:hypothetical protein
VSDSNSGRGPGDDDFEPHTELERLLLGSGRLDAPPEGARSAAIARLTSRARLVSRPGGRAPARVGMLLSLLCAAGLVLGVALWRRPSGVPVELSAEPPATEAGPSPVKQTRSRAELPACPKTVSSAGKVPLIDDMEDGNARILLEDGRSGAWSLYDDGTGKLTPRGGGTLHPSRIKGARGTSRSAVHVSGEHFTTWGVALSVDLVSHACYDASGYTGIQFWARGHGRIYVGVRMIDVVDVKFGGLCSGDNCYNTHRKPIVLTPTWQHHEMRWNELEQDGRPGHIDFDPRRIFSIDFTVHAPDTPFDLWVDDLAFLSPQP